jgi:hypothetical protein
LLPDVEEGRIKLPNLLLDKGPLLPPLLIAVGQPRPKEDTTQARNGRDYRQGEYRKNPHIGTPHRKHRTDHLRKAL